MAERMRGAILLAALLLASHAGAAELIVLQQPACVWCRAFEREIAPAYAKTTEGKRAPLRRVDITAPWPADLAFVPRERFTPVFILIDQGREFGRIRGYPGDAFFYGLLDNMLADLDRGRSTTPDPNAAAPAGATPVR